MTTHTGRDVGVTADGARNVILEAEVKALHAPRRGGCVGSKLIFSFPMSTSRISSRERDGAGEEGKDSEQVLGAMGNQNLSRLSLFMSLVPGREKLASQCHELTCFFKHWVTIVIHQTYEL